VLKTIDSTHNDPWKTLTKPHLSGSTNIFPEPSRITHPYAIRLLAALKIIKFLLKTMHEQTWIEIASF